MPLSRPRAMAVSTELQDIVVRLRSLEAKYALEDGHPGVGHMCDGLSVTLLAALRAHAEVVANASRLGLVLALGEPPLNNALRAFSEDWSEVSTEDSRHISKDSTPVHAKHSILVEPINKHMFNRWTTYRVEYWPGMTINDLRTQFSKTKNIPVTRVVASNKLGSFSVLGDDEPVENATILFTRRLTTDVRPQQQPVLSRAQALALTNDFIMSLEKISSEKREARLVDVRAGIMGKYGIPANAAGFRDMQRSYDVWVPLCQEQLQRTEYLSALLGKNPFCYALSFGF